MTDELSALATLTRLGGQRVESTMEDFYLKWEKNPIVLDKWFSVQAMRSHTGGVNALIALTQSSRYEPNNPNRVRALIGGFAMGNPDLFHKIEIWRKLDTHRQSLISAELDRIIASKPSKNVLEIAKKTRGE